VSDPRNALDAIGALADGEIDIADAALQLARIDAPDADWRLARAHLSELARDAVSAAAEVEPDDLAGRVAALAGLISGRHGYRGDDETYDDPANANLIRVIERRRGLPVALGILWLHCAQAAGWGAHGINFPAHFLLAMEGDKAKAVLDVFAGGTPLDARELRGLLKRLQGEKAELTPGLLRPMSNRDVLLRLQENIKGRRLQAGDFAGALAAVEDMLRIAPDSALQWRDAALINQHLDHVAAALRCYEQYLALVPSGDAASRIRAAMDELRTRLN
jgi:regulator of sirC expression with transglutaminase-like and TPR domain